MSYASRLNEFARVQQDSALWGQKIEDAQRRQAELLAYRDYVQSDAYVAEVAREQLNMVQPGDNVVVVVASDASQELVSAVNNQAVEAAEVQTPIWRQWFNLFVQQSPTARTEL